MATVPTVEAPTQSINGGPIRVNAPAEAFGASVLGQAASKFGATEQAESSALFQHAVQFQEVNNRLAADKATMSTVQQVDAYREKYASENNGLAAYTNLGTAYKDLQAIQDEHAKNLTAPAQAEYLQSSRRYVAGVRSQLTSLALTARHKDLIDTNSGIIQNAQASAVSNIDDPAAVDAAVKTIAERTALLTNPQYLGLSAPLAEAELRKNVGAIYFSGAKLAIDSGDIPKAQALYEAHKNDMTPEQSVGIASALRSGAQDFVVKGFADDIAEGRVPVDRSPAVAPAANARGGTFSDLAEPEVLAGLRADPAGFIKGITGMEVLLTSGHRTPAQNAAARGSPTSEHLSNQAWDFVPKGGQSVVQLAQAIHDSGIPYDQLEVAANHVHVGLRDANLRQETIGLLAGSVRGGEAAPAASTVPAPPTIHANSDPAQVRADYDTYILAAANARFGNNPVLEQRAVAAARNEVSVRIQALAQSQVAAFNRLNQAITGGTSSGNSVGQVSDLQHAYSGSANDLAVLPPGTRATLENELNRSAQGLGSFNTSEMQANADRLLGLSGSDPATFADPTKTNLTQEHLSAPNRTKLLSLQASLERKADAQAASASKLQNLLKDPIVANITKGLDQTHYNQFIGALQGRIDALGRDAKPDEVGTIAQTILSETSIGNSKYGGIPQTAKDKINAMYQKALKRDANDIELYRAYQQGPKYYGG